jgi:ketosteroid isomerase-like protein
MSTSLNSTELVALVERYFASVDRMDIDATLACFEPDATFTIATFNTIYQGRDTGIRSMFERLNSRYSRVWHGHFDHIIQVPSRVASQFRVENTLLDGSLSVKNNCNFFSVRGTRFDAVQVYMSGDNSLV